MFAGISERSQSEMNSTGHNRKLTDLENLSSKCSLRISFEKVNVMLRFVYELHKTHRVRRSSGESIVALKLKLSYPYSSA